MRCLGLGPRLTMPLFMLSRCISVQGLQPDVCEEALLIAALPLGPVKTLSQGPPCKSAVSRRAECRFTDVVKVHSPCFK